MSACKHIIEQPQPASADDGFVTGQLLRQCIRSIATIATVTMTAPQTCVHLQVAKMTVPGSRSTPGNARRSPVSLLMRVRTD